MNKRNRIHIDTVEDAYRAYVRLKPAAKDIDLVIPAKKKKSSKSR